jgi:hypothetical protein
MYMYLQDLWNSWTQARKSDPSMPRTPTIKIVDLPEVIIAMERNDEKYADVGFFPSTTSVEAMKEVRGQHKSRAKPYARMWQM